MNWRRSTGLVISLCLIMLLCGNSLPAQAEMVVELPVLAAIKANNRGVLNVMLLIWDQKPQPNPVQLQWLDFRVRLGETQLDAMGEAFAYAVERTPGAQHTGLVTVAGIAYANANSDGPSAGAAMAVGFIAMFKGDRIQRAVALTGTFESEGRIGWVGGIPDKIRAAAREGYKTILVPSGQMYTGWNLNELALELNVTVKEVATVDEAYVIMTGRHI